MRKPAVLLGEHGSPAVGRMPMPGLRFDAGVVAKAGNEDGSGLIGGSVIVDPNGIIAAQAQTLGDEVVMADCDLDACRQGKDKMFNFAAHRRPEHYRRIVDQVGAETVP